MTISCADCGATQSVPVLPPGATAECHRCDRTLAHRAPVRIDVPLAAAAARLVLLPPAVFLPLFDSTIQNLVFEESRLVSSVGTIYREVWFPFAFGFLFFAFLFPALRALMHVLVLGSIRFGWSLPQRGRIFRFSEELRVWSMTEVVVIAGIVAFIRANVSADVDIRVGAWCYLAVAILALAGELSIDRRAVWNAIHPDPAHLPAHYMPCEVCELAVTTRRPGDPCPRCGATLDRRMAWRFTPAVGTLVAAVPLCIPAYDAAVMVNDQLTGVLEHTVIGTVQLLADRGYWQFGLIVLIAGVVIPVLELVGLIWLLSTVRYPSADGLVLRTRVYRVLHALVRWPLIIPFIAALAAPIVDFRGIDDIVAGPGATPLFLLIVLVMLAERFFAPRLMWKAAGELG